MQAAETPGRGRAQALVLLLSLLYGLGHLFWYWTTPLGQVAVLDERENLQIAEQIYTGSLPREPFYRAMVYPLVLAGLRLAGVDYDQMPYAATLLGLALHLGGALLVQSIARRWFARTGAGLLAGLLYGLNPVLLHFATQILDGTLANIFFLIGLRLLPAAGDQPRPGPVAGLSMAWAAAALTRPQFLPLWLLFGAVWWLAARPAPPSRRTALGLVTIAAAAGAALWLLQATANWNTGGRFWFLPWQGAYNLWAANKPDARGWYYTQSIALQPGPDATIHENPARLESLQLYHQNTGRDGRMEIDAFNAHWRQRLQDSITADPARLTGLALGKIQALLNNHEQYNNKTYAFHKALSPWLRPNPISWGILLVAAIGGAGWLIQHDRPRSHALALVLLTVTAGIALFYVSARFRLPLVALLCLLSGGTLARWPEWWPARGSRRVGFVFIALLIGFAGFNRFSGVASTATQVEDHMLLANAAMRTGNDELAWEHAGAVLDYQPGRRDALRLAVASYCNLLQSGRAKPGTETVWQKQAAALAGTTPVTAREPELIVAALALWRAGDPAGVALWRGQYAQHRNSEALAALFLTGVATPEEAARLSDPKIPAGPFVRMARATGQTANDPDASLLQAYRERLFHRSAPSLPPTP